MHANEPERAIHHQEVASLYALRYEYHGLTHGRFRIV